MEPYVNKVGMHRAAICRIQGYHELTPINANSKLTFIGADLRLKKIFADMMVFPA